MKDKRILITGGAGFIGSELVRQLAPQCAQVVAVDNLVNGRRENLDGVPGADLEIADIRDSGRMSALLRGVDTVFHLACLGVRHSIHSPRENHDVNATATLELLRAARSAGVSRFVYTSSSEVYGTAMRVPMSEEHPTFPMTVYGASKLAGECYVRAFHRTYSYPAVVLRPFNAYGPRCHHEGDSGEVIPKFMLRCLAGLPMVVFGDGAQTRDFTFVSDTVRGIVAAAQCDAAIGQTINLGSGAEIAIGDLAAMVASVCGRQDAQVQHDIPRPGDVLRLFSDSRKARDLLGFEPAVRIQDGLKRLRDWYAGSGQSPEALLRSEIVRNWEAAQ
ncbi:MAG TPA: GDP-mannose 4,6-dehydratase [Bryobacteraceae bacterium]|nr:GDP-mannose 4,6-dehydratase [Bryobacteraceae bacterium]